MFTCDPLENLPHSLGSEVDLLLLIVLIDVLPLSDHVQARALDLRLVVPAPTVAAQPALLVG